MAPSQDLRLPHDQHLRWRVLVIVLAICGLTVSLSTRTFRLTIFPHPNSPVCCRHKQFASTWTVMPLIGRALFQSPRLCPSRCSIHASLQQGPRCPVFSSTKVFPIVRLHPASRSLPLI